MQICTAAGLVRRPLRTDPVPCIEQQPDWIFVAIAIAERRTLPQ